MKSHSFILKAGFLPLKTTETVARLTEEAIAEAGFELCDVEFAKEYGNWVLTLFIDKEGGVTIDDCERISRLVDPILDEADPIEQAYFLSVSSLGLDRPLKKEKDYRRNLGKEITVRLYAPVEGKKEFSGTLDAFDADGFTLIENNGETRRFLKKDAALVKPYITF